MSGSEGTFRGWGDPASAKEEKSGSWIHVPARGGVKLIVLSSEPVGYRGHWIRGAMHRCPGRMCALCDQHRGSQVRYCFSVYEVGSGTTGLLEVGASAAEAMWQCAQREGRLRGLVFTLRKEGQKERGRILVTCEPSLMSTELLPAADDVEGHLARQFQEGTSETEAVAPVLPGVLR